MKNIAVIGGGIVGSTAAYYLSKDPNINVTLFDYQKGQATKAAAGIICPWFSKRRNKPWYRLSNQGAHFYLDLLQDMAADGLQTKAYQKKTTWIVKKKEKLAHDLLKIGHKRQENAPLIQQLEIISTEQIQSVFPNLNPDFHVIETDAGAIIDGEQFCHDLQQLAVNNGAQIIEDQVAIRHLSANSVQISGHHTERQDFSGAILATGAWLAELLEPLDYHVDVRPQKGQLAVYQTTYPTDQLPLIMLDGEGDIIPHQQGQIFVGASHEDDKGFDLTEDMSPLTELIDEFDRFFPTMADIKPDQIKIGTRAYTSDYTPFFGHLSDAPHITVASGLGSSGLTSGPLIGYELAHSYIDGQTTINWDDYPVENYISKKR